MSDFIEGSEPQGQSSFTESGDVRAAIVHAVEGGANGWAHEAHIEGDATP